MMLIFVLILPIMSICIDVYRNLDMCLDRYRQKYF